MEAEMEIQPFRLPGLDFSNRPLVIAGPCSAESEEQVLQTAKALKETGVEIFRAGIWKPRTSPGEFEGIGPEGFAWLKKVKKETGMLVTTEAGNEKHVEEALRHGVDILWIGARTTTSPFAVEEIATTLEGKDVPVMVKNPIQPEPAVWIGAIERLFQHGIRNIAAIHRGFSTYSRSRYRYPPLWDIPRQLKKKFPGLTILCDPSHMSGDRKLIPGICKKAMRLKYDGFMIEVHKDPASARVDGPQQLSPEMFTKLYHRINQTPR